MGVVEVVRDELVEIDRFETQDRRDSKDRDERGCKDRLEVLRGIRSR